MRMSFENFLKMKSFEDCYLTAQRDSTGVMMIGYGRPIGARRGYTITQEQADKWFIERVEGLEKVLMEIPQLAELPPHRWDAIVSFTIKTGLNNLKKSILLRKIRRNPEDKKIYIEFMRWVKGRDAELTKTLTRRKWEARLWEGEA